MKRRNFISVLSVAPAVFPFAARAQHTGKPYHIVVLTRAGMGAGWHAATRQRHWLAWHDELVRLGYAEGKNVVISFREGESDRRRIDEQIREIVRLKPDVIFAPAQNIVEALKDATSTIPIVAILADPVGLGLVASLSRPAGNITGFSIDAGMETLAKRFALLKDAVPTLSRIAYLAARPIWESKFAEMGRDAARQVGIEMIGAPVDSPANSANYRHAFGAMVQNRADSLYVSGSGENLTHRQIIADLAIAARLPSVTFYRENVEAGGLLSYGSDVVDLFRLAAGYVDRILRGANPVDLPFQQPTKFEMVVNLKTARALSLTIPPPLLVRADEVIE